MHHTVEANRAFKSETSKDNGQVGECVGNLSMGNLLIGSGNRHMDRGLVRFS